MEFDPGYCNVALARFEAMTETAAKLDGTAPRRTRAGTDREQNFLTLLKAG